MPTRCTGAATCSGIRNSWPGRTRADKPDKPDRRSGRPPALLRPSRSPKSPRASEASLRYEEAKLLSRGSVDEQDGGMIRRIAFLDYIGWNDFPLAIFQVLPLV